MNTSFFQKFPVLATGLIFLFILFSAGQSKPATSISSIDTFVEEQMRHLDIPGMAIVIVKDARIEYARGYGIADPAGRSVTPQTPFLAASLSKSITALGIMQLVEEGKIRLEDPIQKHLPWFRVNDTAASSQITVRHLLHHTSGLSEFEGYIRNLETDSGEQALENSLRRLSESKLTSLPGTQFEYSNTNYDLLGLLIQTISGKPYQTYIRDEIFTPTGMTNSYTRLEEARDHGLSQGYTSFFGMTIPYDRWMPYSQTVIPSAGLFLSAEDLGKYLIIHLNEGRVPEGEQILSPAGIVQLHTPGVEINDNIFYTMGWTQFSFTEAVPSDDSDLPAPLALAHAGEWANYRALMVMVPERDLGIAMLINKNDPRKSSEYDRIGWNISLLAMGLTPVEFPSNEDFLTRYGHIIGGILVLLLIVSMIWSIGRLRKISIFPQTVRQIKQHTLLFFVILPLVDLLIAGYILLFEIESPQGLWLDIAFFPDAGVLYIFLLTLTIVWGIVRTFRAVLLNRRMRLNRIGQSTITQSVNSGGG